MSSLHSPLLLYPQRWRPRRETTTHLPALLPGHSEMICSSCFFHLFLSLCPHFCPSLLFKRSSYSLLPFWQTFHPCSLCLILNPSFLYFHPCCSFIIALVITSHICEAFSVASSVSLCVVPYMILTRFLTLISLYQLYHSQTTDACADKFQITPF